MIVNNKKDLGIRLSEEQFLIDGIIAKQTEFLANRKKAGFFTEDEFTYGVERVVQMISDDYEHINTNYLIKDTAFDMASKIPLSDKFDIKFLANVPNKKATFLLGKDFTVRYIKQDNNIFVFYLFITDTEDGDYLNFFFSRMDLVTGEIIFPVDEQEGDVSFTLDAIPVDRIGKNGAVQLATFIRLLLFVELSDINIEVLEPNQKTGTRKTGKVVNQSKTNIVVVDSKWNTVSVRTESFLVNGHWRMQPCGVGKRERRLIWIDTFEKKGYVRRKNLLSNPNTAQNG